jgi:hypothetical protein
MSKRLQKPQRESKWAKVEDLEDPNALVFCCWHQLQQASSRVWFDSQAAEPEFETAKTLATRNTMRADGALLANSGGRVWRAVNHRFRRAPSSETQKYSPALHFTAVTDRLKYLG